MALIKESLKELARRRLLERRRSLVARKQTAEEGAQELFEEREADWEDGSAAAL